MVADNPLVPAVSKMTLAVAADSGWFEVDFGKAEQFDWGRGRGCGMLDLANQGDNPAEFCELPVRKSCSSNLRSINKCRISRYSSEKYLNLGYKACDESKFRNRFSQNHLQNESICMEMKVHARMRSLGRK